MFIMFIMLCASLYLNYLTYYGKLDMFAAGVSKEPEVQTDFVQQVMSLWAWFSPSVDVIAIMAVIGIFTKILMCEGCCVGHLLVC